MNSQQLHDALSQLPDDLIEETDRRRNRNKSVIPFRRYAAMAACFVLVLAAGLLSRTLLQPKGATETAVYEAAEEPAAQKPEISLTTDQITIAGGMEDAAPEEAPEEKSAPAEDTANSAGFSLRSATLPSAATTFSLRMLQQTADPEKNTLLSPLSVLSALGMTANGADGQTLAQIETALGIDTAALNTLLSHQSSALGIANSLWLRDDGSLTVQEDYLQTVTEAYQAEVFPSVFDSAALNRLNSWVSEKTDGMIPKMLDRIEENALMYLVNALTFEADWDDPYEAYQVNDDTFTTESGLEQPVRMMHSKEDWYLETANATGFLKYYKNNRYAFAALLPAEGTTVSQLLSTLNTEDLLPQLLSPQEAVVHASLPKFSTDYDIELSETLKSLGITDAFDLHAADFSRLGTSDAGNLYLGRVQHKTCIQVTEQGTKAAAATMTEILAGSAYNPDIKVVTLDRPFLYLIMDCQDGMPIFIGAQMDMTGTPTE